MPSPEDDGLAKTPAKPHTRQKHYYFQKYVDAFTTAMRRKDWDSLHYVDLFAGAGIEQLESGELLWGSPLIAAQAPVAFDMLHLCEINAAKFDALRSRIERLGRFDNTQLLHGDANDVVQQVVESIPRGSLSFAFLDPYGLHLRYSTLQLLSKRRCDALVFFPDRVDLLRNWKLNYHEDPDSNPDQVFGDGADWRSIFNDKPQSAWISALTRLYQDQLGALGYTHCYSERIYANNRPLYQLIFATRHPAGGKIWRGISRTKADRQTTFDFED